MRYVVLLLLLLVGCQERPQAPVIVEYKAPPPEPKPPPELPIGANHPLVPEGFWTKELWYDENADFDNEPPNERQFIYADHGRNGSWVSSRTYYGPGTKNGEWAHEGVTCFTINRHDTRWYCRKNQHNWMSEDDQLEGEVEIGPCNIGLTSLYVNGEELEGCFYEGCNIGLTFEDRSADLDLVGQWVQGKGEFKP